MKYNSIIKNFPHFLHGGDYNPDQWQRFPEVIDEDFRLMKLAGCNTFSIGIFSWTSYEPEDGEYHFGWLDDIMDRLAAQGCNAILATPSGAKPAWMAHEYPEIRRVRQDGIREPYNARHNHCWTSPVYRRKVAEINRRLAERYRQHPALAAWHISNEYGGECFCDKCQAAFHQWLKNKYQSIDALHAAWWSDFWNHQYTSFEEINPADYCVDGLTLDWKRFNTWICCDFIRNEIKPLRELTPDIPITTNMMGVSEVLDYWRVAELCDFIADDCYPSWDGAPQYDEEAARYAMMHDMHRCMKQGRPFLMMESTPSNLNWKEYYRLKRPGVHQLEMLLAMGHGADGTMYFQWRKGRGGCEKFHGAVIDHVGHENTRVFRDVAQIGRIHQKIDDIVGTSIPTQAAIIYDWEVRWALNACGGPTHHNKKLLETVQAHYRALFRLNTPMDVIESTSDYSKYKLLVAPMLFMLKPGVADRLKEFVAAGGTLVCTYLSGYVDATNLHFTGGCPGDGLRQLFGIWSEELDGFTPNDRQTIRILSNNELCIDGEFTAVEFAEIIHPEGAQTLAVYGHDFYAGQAAVTVNHYGHGQAFYLAARTGDDFLSAFYQRIIAVSGVTTVLPPETSAGIHASIRTDGNRHFMFLYNFKPEENYLNMGAGKFRDLVSGKDISGVFTLPGYYSTILEKNVN